MWKPIVLIIDDDENLLQSIETVLRHKYSVSVATSGIQGIQLAHRIHPDLVVLDVVMPNLDGYETCRRLRQDPLLKDTPILFLSGMDTIDSKVEGFEAGADDYLTKPFDLRELAYRVKAIMRRVTVQQEPPAEPILTQSGLKLDCRSYEVETEYGTSRLTPVEFDLLYYLMSRPDETFSAARLLQEVWDYPLDTGSPDLVRMHIRNIRTKIEPEPSSPRYLITIPRHGYTIG